ncbi:patatin-like phospholipase family protein [Hyphomonas sp. WL0036]|uniref:patatin-like phospholipase family protein n=1 Tax=Hyphomonas sediminis TaxID=2866160 RepID=UPI001C81779F|nr:patatin-like phospholipase family protein [Hyphomonas sediminis]MBY9067459.1 patatin-like phospholipase family protein [Hyphomonas sediminis]
MKRGRTSRLFRTGLLAWFSIVLTGSCASLPPLPINAPLIHGHTRSLTTPVPALGEEAIGLAFSGGGARAAAFSYGVLEGLADLDASDGRKQINHIAFITAVSGGTLTASWFGLYGPDGLGDFRATLLDKNWQRQAHTSLLSPANWIGALQGGVNGPTQIAEWLDREVYKGARLDAFQGPPIILNAADLRGGVPFAFAPPWFDALCSDLGKVRVADAVAAASAYPLGIRPVLLEAFPESCAHAQLNWAETLMNDPASSAVGRATANTMARYHAGTSARYLHLLDGGVVDNFGLAGLGILHEASRLPYGPLLSPQAAVRLKRMRIIVVNAERTQDELSGNAQRGPGGITLIDAVAGHTVDAAKMNAYDAFAGKLREWQNETIAWRCALSGPEATDLGAPPGWNCRDLTFTIEMTGFSDLAPERAAALGKIPTRLSLPSDQVDMAISAGRDVVSKRFHPGIQQHPQSLATPP